MPARPAGRSPRAGEPLPDTVNGDPAVYVAGDSLRCAECAAEIGAGALVHYEAQKPLCLGCALFESLAFLPSGDVALTRRACKHSRHRAVVLEWSRRGKRYERRGTLLEPEAIRRARAECEADAPARAQQRAQAAVRREAEERAYVAEFTAAVRLLFPGCPLAEAREIALHACEKSSGRVGRTAAAKELEPEMVRLAVIAHVRHLHTEYDSIIARTHDKRDSRARIKGTVAEVLQAWERGAAAPGVL